MAEEAAAKAAVGLAGSRENVYLLTYSFNQDFSCFVCGTTAGFRVFALEDNAKSSAISEKLRREHSPGFRHSSVMLISMLFKSANFAMVNQTLEPQGEPAPGCMNKVQIWDERKQKVVAELRCRNEVKGVCLHNSVIVMVCEYVIYVYTSGEHLKVILHLDTGSNKLGLCVVAVSSDPWLLCCPAQNKGAVRIQVGQDAGATHVFQAHQSGLAALALNASGSLLATASESGTVAKVFRTSDGQALYRLRRSTRSAVISSLAFRSDDNFLAMASSSATVHIFKLDSSTAEVDTDRGEKDKENSSPALGPQDLRPRPSLSGTISALQTLQSKAAEAVRGLTYLADLRSFGQFRLPDMDGGQPAVDTRSKQSKIVGPILAFHKTEPRLYVLHFNGFLYECSFQPDYDLSRGAQECGFVAATTWFATRPDFKVSAPITELKTEPGGENEGALAKVALRRIGEEASANAVSAALELLGPCAREVEAEAPAQASESEVEADAGSEASPNKKKKLHDHRKLFKEGQKALTPPVADPTRAFYESLLEEKPDSAIAIRFCVEHGVKPNEEHKKLLKKYSVLKEKGAFNVATKIKRVLEKKHLKLGVKKDKKAKKEKKDGVLLRVVADVAIPAQISRPTCEHPPPITRSEDVLDDLPISALGAVHVIASRGEDFGGSGDLAEFRRLGLARDPVLEVSRTMGSLARSMASLSLALARTQDLAAMKGFAKGGKKGKDAKGFPGGGPGGFPAKGYGKSGGKGEMDTWQMGQMSMKGKSKSPFGDGKAGKGFSPKGQMGKDSFGKDGGKAKGQSAELAVSGCWHETVGSIIRGEYFRSGSNHGRPVYKKLGPGQEVQIYFWDSRDGPNMCGWWFGASVGGDMVWSFRPGAEGQTPPRQALLIAFTCLSTHSLSLVKPGHSPEVALTREVQQIKANASSEEDADAQEHGILWVKNTGKFCLGILLSLVAVTASWYFERQLARLECLMSIGRSMCRSVQDAKAVPENSGCLVHLSGELKPEIPIQDPRFACQKLSTGCGRLRTQVQVYQWVDGRNSQLQQQWSEDPQSFSLSRRDPSKKTPPLALAVGTTITNSTSVKFGLGFVLPRGLLDQCSSFKSAAPLLGSEVFTHSGKMRFLLHSDGRYYWRAGGDSAAENIASEPMLGDLRVTFEMAASGRATVLALQAADDACDGSATLLPYRLVPQVYEEGEHKRLVVQEARKSRVGLAQEDQVCPQSRLCFSCNFVAGCCTGVATPEIFRLYEGHQSLDSCFSKLRKSSSVDVGLGSWSFRLVVLSVMTAGIHISFSEGIMHMLPISRSMTDTPGTVPRFVVSACMSLAITSAIISTVFFPYKVGKAFVHLAAAAFFLVLPLILMS
ncbi:ATG18A [Symbiodinium microadriaticum]|nr:ATG18A [Symbiodinium microadriaticum]